MIATPLALPILLSLAGCEQVQDIKDTVDGLTNPLVVLGLHMGVEAPESDVIDLSETAFAEGASARVFLFDAGDVASLGDTPVTGATVALVSASNAGGFSLEDQGGGTYAARGADGLAYAPEEITVDIALDDGDSSISSVSPDGAEAGIATSHSAGNPMGVDLSGQDFDGVLVVVIDMSNSQLTWSNEPDSVEELYELTHGSGDPSVEIPGEAFELPGIYAVGVAGTVNAEVEDMVEVNTGLSSLVAGKWRFYPVEVQ